MALSKMVVRDYFFVLMPGPAPTANDDFYGSITRCRKLRRGTYGRSASRRVG
jgi:hypothetical protein